MAEPTYAETPEQWERTHQLADAIARLQGSPDTKAREILTSEEADGEMRTFVLSRKNLHHGQRWSFFELDVDGKPHLMAKARDPETLKTTIAQNVRTAGDASDKPEIAASASTGYEKSTEFLWPTEAEMAAAAVPHEPSPQAGAGGRRSALAQLGETLWNILDQTPSPAERSATPPPIPQFWGAAAHTGAGGGVAPPGMSGY